MGEQTGLFGSTGKQSFHKHRNQQWNGVHRSVLPHEKEGRGATVLWLDRLGCRVEWSDAEAREQCLDGADATINLAGAPIAGGRWTDVRKRLLMESRVLSTRLLVETLSRRSSKPRTLINASSIGYYGASDDRVLDEGAARGQGYLADLCLACESEALRVAEFGARVVTLRTGMVLEQDGGALPKMLLPFRLFAGGPIMPGTQWVPWIHRRDHIGLIQWLLTTPSISGSVNAVAPEAVMMNQFCDALGRVLHRPSWLLVPGFALHVALGELGTLMTTANGSFHRRHSPRDMPFTTRNWNRPCGDHDIGINEYRTGSGRSPDTVNCRKRAHEL